MNGSIIAFFILGFGLCLPCEGRADPENFICKASKSIGFKYDADSKSWVPTAFRPAEYELKELTFDSTDLKKVYVPRELKPILAPGFKIFSFLSFPDKELLQFCSETDFRISLSESPVKIIVCPPEDTSSNITKYLTSATQPEFHVRFSSNKQLFSMYFEGGYLDHEIDPKPETDTPALEIGRCEEL